MGAGCSNGVRDNRQMTGMMPTFCARQLGHSVEAFLHTYSKWLDGQQDDLEMNRLEARIAKNKIGECRGYIGGTPSGHAPRVPLRSLYQWVRLPCPSALHSCPMSAPGPSFELPPDLHVLIEHQVWVQPLPDGSARVGITALGIALSGEIYMCRPKREGTALAQGDTLAVVELAKAIVAVKSPASGPIIETNPALVERPELVHRDPYGQGWIARLQLSDWPGDQARLLDGPAAAQAMAHHAHAHRADLVPATSTTFLPPSA